MKLSQLTMFLIGCAFLFNSCDRKEKPVINTNKESAYLNFSLGESTLKNKNEHQITLFGCNTVLDTMSSDWHGQKTFQWKKSNQVLSGVPYGYRKEGDKEYYISKYYIASPPVLKFDSTKTVDSNTLYDIGLVTPDEFQFDGKLPVQMVYLDYNILKPMHVTYFDINFGDIDMFIPFRVECYDLPWLNKNGIANAEGGSGIGSLKKGTHADRLFLPYYFEGEMEKFVDTRVSLLNDIILNYEFKFLIGDELFDSINLKELYEEDFQGPLQIIALEREPFDIPEGCQKPESGKGPFGR